MVIRAHMRGVAEVDLSLFPLRQSLDPRECLLEPLLHQRLVPFQRTMQRPLAGDAELSEQSPDNEISNLSLISVATISRVHNAKENLSCSGFFCVTVS